MQTRIAANIYQVPLVKSMALLRPYLDDADCRFIFINKPGEVITKNNDGSKIFHSVPELDHTYCYNLARLTAAYSRQILDEHNPIISASLPEGERIDITIPPVNADGYIAIIIRKATLEVTLESCINNDVNREVAIEHAPTIDDTRPRHIRALHCFLEPSKDCAPSVADGIRHISAEIYHQQSKQTGIFSLTSRKTSIWSLIRKHLDTPFDDVIRNYQGIYLQELLESLRLSTIGKIRPKWRIDTIEWDKIADSRPLNMNDWQNLLVPTTQPAKTNLIADVDLILNSINAWDQSICFAIHSSTDLCDDRAHGEEHSQFQATLDTIRSFLSYLGFLLPQTAKDPLQQNEGDLRDGSLPYKKTRLNQTNYCELCWRRTMRAAEINRIGNLGTDNQHLESSWSLHLQGTNHAFIAKRLGISKQAVLSNIQIMQAIQKARHLNDRFCHEHDPREATSHYRTDISYKNAFQRELEALDGSNTPIFIFRFPPPPGADEQELRKTAYDQVHAGIRPLTSLDNPSLLEQVLDLYQQGIPQVKIAKMLGKHQQAVTREIKKIKKLLLIRQNEQFICPTSEESWQKSINSPFVQQVIALYLNGHSVAEIARKTNRFKHTIQSAIYWVNNTDIPTIEE